MSAPTFVRLVVAVVTLWTVSARAEAPGSAPPPRILGTLDPTTGRFTPDAVPDAAGSNISGTLNIVVKLDAPGFGGQGRPSVACASNIIYVVVNASGNEANAGGNHVSQQFLTLSKDGKGNQILTGTGPVDFNLRSPNTGTFYAMILINCYFTYNFQEVFTKQVSLKMDSGQNNVPVTGSMQGQGYP